MNTSYHYTLDGEIKRISDKFQGEFYFRKDLDGYCYDDITELKISEIISQHSKPLKCVVKILEIQYQPLHIKYELLDVSEEYDLKKHTVLEDMKQALLELHQLDIIYIDLKPDNIGWNSRTQRWTLFDFNCSGIQMKDGLRWFRFPPEYYQFRQITNVRNNIKQYLENSNLPETKKKELLEVSQSKKLVSIDRFGYLICFNR